MGTILTSYGGAAEDHEGYAAQVLDDGSLTGTHSAENRARMVGAVVACGCGWVGTTRYPTREEFDEAAEALALAEWEHAHTRPFLAAVRHTELLRLRVLLRRAATVAGEVRDVPRSARQLAEQLDHVTELLESATGLARRLAEQAHEQAEHDDRGEWPRGES
ncbi:MAG: hypothetical protein GEV09_04640 [Pseudonocardiaceae bacterium]|nr:hypothetical protein [Pseudonocardiaceae bacterium]